jgi:hypothetical protein
MTSDQEKIDRLKKRRNWLWERIYKADKDGNNRQVLSFDRAEASALDWAINKLEVNEVPLKEEH